MSDLSAVIVGAGIGGMTAALALRQTPLVRNAEGFAEHPCPLASECVVTAVLEVLAVLWSPSAGEQEKLKALKDLDL